ncbi:MAG: hypothetical protein AABZ74_12310 [Cyanobacteriota bacterium]
MTIRIGQIFAILFCLFSISLIFINPNFDIFLLLVIFFILLPYIIYKITFILKEAWLSYIFVLFYFIYLLNYISISNFNASNQSDGKVASVMYRMHTFQTIIETYSVDTDGFYPKNVEEVYKFANTGNNTYWKDFRNPFTNQTGKGKSYDDFSTVSKKFNSYSEKFYFIGKTGVVYYSPVIDKKGKISKYFIYGGARKDDIILDSKTGIPFTLSNN